MAKLRRRLRSEAGLALPLALITVATAGVLGGSVIQFTTSNSAGAQVSDAGLRAQALAEAGVAYAQATLYNSGSPTMANAVPETTRQMDGGSTTYYGTLSGSTWTLIGIGRVRNPAGQGDVIRSSRSRARLGSAQRGTSNNAVWNYVYVDDATATTSLGNSVNVNIPLYVRGNLRLSNTAQVSGYALQVGGTLEFQNSAHVGTAESPIHEAHIGGGCRVGSSGAFVKPCGSAQRVFATISDATPTTFVKPPVDLAGWYYNAQPGPRHGCTTGSFPGGFDNDTVPNSSRGAVDLTPSSAYDCRVYDGAGALVGQISWSPATQALTIAGTLYFDGSIVFSQSNRAIYAGRATIYAAGDISLSNQTVLCGDPECDDDWDPQQNLLALVSGRNVTIGNNTSFQGAIYAVNDYAEDNSSTVWGPIIARRVALANSSVNHYVPIGTLMPGMPATYEDVATITNEPGSWG